MTTRHTFRALRQAYCEIMSIPHKLKYTVILTEVYNYIMSTQHKLKILL